MYKNIKRWSTLGDAWTDRNAPRIDIEGRAKTFKKLIELIPIHRVHNILEVGCNKGYNLTAISTIGNYELTGIDLLPYAIENSDCTAKLMVASGFKLPFEDKEFDLVLACDYFDSFDYKELLKITKETSRVASRYILVIDYYPFDISEKVEISITYIGTSDIYWMRRYTDKIPDFQCINRGPPALLLPGFNEPILSWWLFQRTKEIFADGIKITVTGITEITEINDSKAPDNLDNLDNLDDLTPKELNLENLKPEPDSDYLYPIIDCPSCGRPNVPVATLSDTNSGEYRTTSYCLNCHQVLEIMPVPKGYLSILELEEEGWDGEL